jgi:hypothetical protein
VRVHPNNNKDTPLPKDTPLGKNPPPGAIIDYWLGKPAKGPVEIDILDASGALVGHMTSTPAPQPPAQQYFASEWTQPPQHLSTEAGAHRAVWSLHYPRPHAAGYGYDIAAILGDETPIKPEGPFVLPGDYTVVLKVDGKEQRQRLHVTEDPRVPASFDDLKAELAFSLDLDKAMERAWKGAGEMQAAHEQLDAISHKLGARDAALKKRVDDLFTRTAAGGRRRGGDGLVALSASFAGLESQMESADAAPTQPDRDGYAESLAKLARAEADWASTRKALDELAPALKKAGFKPITYPAMDRMHVDAPEGGEDMP